MSLQRGVKSAKWGFLGGAVVESPPADAGSGRAPVREDPTCRGAAGPVSHGRRARVRSLCSATGEATTVRGPRTAKINK